MKRAPTRITAGRQIHNALCLLVLLGSGSAFVPEANAAETPQFETHIAPLFKRHCVKCHNAELRKADLDLSTPQGLFRGGESGPVLVSGAPEKSTLYEQVHEGAMPPAEQSQLPAPDIETIRLWIKSGTPFVARIALDELTWANSRRALLKEALVGLGNGIVLGVVGALVAWLLSGSIFLGLILALAMVINILVAAVAATLIPIALRAMKVDPALASAVFITTLTDVFGFFAFLGLATLFLDYLNQAA